MPSPHGVFCESPHKAFIESPHGVRGCGVSAASTPFYFALSWTGISFGWDLTFFNLNTNVAYDMKTRLYRIDSGRVTWAATRPDEPPSSYETSVQDPSPIYFGGVVRLDFNTHGLFLTRIVRVVENSPSSFTTEYESEAIDASTGAAAAVRGFIQTSAVGGSHDAPIHMCANKQHVFLLSLNPPFTWLRLDANLNLIDQGAYTGPYFDANSDSDTSINSSHRGFERPVITPLGDIRHYNLILDRNDPSQVLEHKRGPLVLGGNFFEHGSGVIAVDASTNIIYGLGANLQTGFGLGTGRVVDATGAKAGLARASRGPSPSGSELLSIGEGLDSEIQGRSPFLASVIWTLDIDPLIRSYVDQLGRPSIPAGAAFKIRNVCHSGGSALIRAVGTLSQKDANGVIVGFDIFAVEIARGFGSQGTSSVNWYLDSAYTQPGDVPIERPVIPPVGNASPIDPTQLFGLNGISIPEIAVASGVLGSGVDYVYQPAN